MAQKVRILVVGGRFMPHQIGIAAESPDVVACIASPDTKQQTETAFSSLKGLSNLQVIEPIEYVRPYNLKEARSKCEQMAKRFPRAEITFDVTSAPKIPSFAALKTAQKLGCRVIVVNSSDGRIINVEPESLDTDFDIQLTLDQYLGCFGRRAVEKFDPKKLSIPESQALEAAKFLGDGDPVKSGVLSCIRQWSQGKGKRTIPLSKTKAIPNDYFTVFKKIEALGLVDRVERNAAGRLSFQLANDFDFDFLKGKWLELLVLNTARSLCDDSGTRIFEAACMSVEIPSNEEKKEIDVACVSRGRLLLFSCKTSNPFRTANLDQLRAVSDLVGGDFTTRIFVTNEFAPHEDKKDERKNFREFQEHAHAHKIVVLCGDQLPNLSTIIKKEMLRPTYRRI